MAAKSKITKRNAASPDRVKILPEVREEVLMRCRRRCCVCFGLRGDLGIKDGQLAHLDQNRVNPKIENLAFLCLECHKQFDTKGNRVLGFTPAEVRHYRDLLHEKLGHDHVEWSLKVRIHRSGYDQALERINRARLVLLEISQQVTVTECPLEPK